MEPPVALRFVDRGQTLGGVGVQEHGCVRTLDAHAQRIEIAEPSGSDHRAGDLDADGI
jgi:hypothetical protein